MDKISFRIHSSGDKFELIRFPKILVPFELLYDLRACCGFDTEVELIKILNAELKLYDQEDLTSSESQDILDLMKWCSFRVVFQPHKIMTGSGVLIDAGLNERNPRCDQEMRLSLQMILGEETARKEIIDIFQAELNQAGKPCLNDDEIAKFYIWWDNTSREFILDGI